MKQLIILFLACFTSAQAQETLTLDGVLKDALSHHPISSQEGTHPRKRKTNDCRTEPELSSANHGVGTNDFAIGCDRTAHSNSIPRILCRTFVERPIQSRSRSTAALV